LFLALRVLGVPEGYETGVLVPGVIGLGSTGVLEVLKSVLVPSVLIPGIAGTRSIGNPGSPGSPGSLKRDERAFLFLV
jgi:hypothetical protein